MKLEKYIKFKLCISIVTLLKHTFLLCHSERILLYNYTTFEVYEINCTFWRILFTLNINTIIFDFILSVHGSIKHVSFTIVTWTKLITNHNPDLFVCKETVTIDKETVRIYIQSKLRITIVTAFVIFHSAFVLMNSLRTFWYIIRIFPLMINHW